MERTFVAPSIDFSQSIFKHTLVPLDDFYFPVVVYSNNDEHNMQGVIEDLAEACAFDWENNQDLYQREYDGNDLVNWIELGNGDAIVNFWRDSHKCELVEDRKFVHQLYAKSYFNA